jgi:GAF domain-containing protein/sugar diacid utilization regulator
MDQREPDGLDRAPGTIVESVFLHVLAEAPSSVLEDELQRLDRERLEHPDHLSADHYAAVRVRELVEHRRRRELEISSLYATASSLAALGEVDDVLATVVRHAHELVGADVTYISVFNDAQTELSLRASQGSISAKFRQAVVPARTGVAGRVLDTRAPYWVANYPRADEIAHSSDFDRTFVEEGLVALLGVPLVAANRVFGVLYAANRVERPFPREEVALLSAFADHAAVALENARLYDESRQALQHLEEAYSTIEGQVEVMERSAAVHEALTGAILVGGGASEIADLVAEHLGGDVIIVDRTDNVLATHASGAAGTPSGVDADDLGAPPWLSDVLHRSLPEATRTGRCVTTSNGHAVRRNVVAVVAGEDYLGAVIHARPDALHPAERRTLERAAQIMGLLTLKQDAVVEAEERVRGELLLEILSSGLPFSDELVSRARSRNLELERVNAVLVVHAPNARRIALARHLHAFARESGALAGEYRGVPTVLIAATDAKEAAAEVYRHLKRGVSAPILVCAAPVATSAHLGHAFLMASRCSKLLRQLGTEDRATTTEHLAVYALLFDPDRVQDLQTFLEDSLGRLIDYDVKGRSDLLGTLSAYFSNSGNLASTARTLHVHINTLLKRMDRIGELLGQDWQHPDTSLRLHLAVRMHQLSCELAANPD